MPLDSDELSAAAVAASASRDLCAVAVVPVRAGREATDTSFVFVVKLMMLLCCCAMGCCCFWVIVCSET